MTRLRSLGAGALLVLVAVGLIAAGDSRAWSGDDAGGKAATAIVMDRDGTWVPEVGYWAEPWDAGGTLHPLLRTQPVGGRWVQATSVTFAVMNRPLYGALGVTGLLVLPVFGLVLAAYAARRLARWAGSPSGRPAFWAVGLCTPVLFYAADAWEHGPAVGLTLAALALALPSDDWRRVLGAGACAGLAVVLRAESAVYVAATVVAVLSVAAERRRWVRAWRVALPGLVGLTIPVMVNTLLERRLLGDAVRVDRAVALAEGAGLQLPSRARDALLTTVGVVADADAAALMIGAGATAAVVLLARWAVDGAPTRRVLATGVIVVGLAGGIAVRVASGLGFVPGWLPTAPLAAVALIGLARRPVSGPRSVMARAALIALPGVWLTSHVGLLATQQGGRYVLLTGALLTVVGAVVLEERGLRRPASMALLGVAGVVSALGVGWHVQRTAEMASLAAWVVRETPTDGVVVSRMPGMGREAGAFYGERRWLTASTDADVLAALQVAHHARAPRVVVLLPPTEGRDPVGDALAAPELGGRRWREIERHRRLLFGVPVTLVVLG